MSAHNERESSEQEHNGNTHKKNFLSNAYEKHYKAMMIISVLLVLFSFAVIGIHYAKTGDFVNRGVSLTGGISLTLPAPKNNVMTQDSLQSYLIQTFPSADINVRTFGAASNLQFSIEASGVDENKLIAALQPKFPQLTAQDFANNKQTVGPTFGASFFTQTLKALFMAFLFMSIVVFLYFGDSVREKWIATILTLIAAFMMFNAKSAITYIIPFIIFVVLIVIYIRDSIPAFGIVLCAFSDLFFSLAIFDLFGHKLSIAGVAAFLMLVGYSIDTDILLSVRVLKRREGTVFDRVVGALKTGVTMSVCALIAVLTAYFLTNSIVIKEIMFILIAGLIGDIIFTWIQNAGILRWFLERKGWK